jgi:hypothetical protein
MSKKHPTRLLTPLQFWIGFTLSVLSFIAAFYYLLRSIPEGSGYIPQPVKKTIWTKPSPNR